MKAKSLRLAAASLCLSFPAAAYAASASVTFSPLTGLTGGSPAGTKVYVADVSGLGLATIQSITIQDNSSGLGGAGGQFSGFDLDAIMLSNTLFASSSDAGAAVGLSVFSFGSGTLFTPGTQRAPVDPKLFGTDLTGMAVDNAVATLGAFDANSTTAIPGASGFLSLGDNGKISFNLTSSVSTTGLFLYIGEVGDNGEVAAGNITVSDRQVDAPLPGTAGAGLALLGGLVAYKLTRRNAEPQAV